MSTPIEDFQKHMDALNESLLQAMVAKVNVLTDFSYLNPDAEGFKEIDERIRDIEMQMWTLKNLASFLMRIYPNRYSQGD